jgi:hypothetical protein
MMTPSPYVAVLAGFLVAAGCVRGPATSSQPTPQRIELVDTLPPALSRPAVPDFTPRWFYDDTYVAKDPRGRPGKFLRNVAVVSFKPEASPTQRRAALRAIRGTVVGGFDGLSAYYIRLPEADQPISSDSLSRVLALLEALPQVAWADAYDVSVKDPDKRR